MEVRRPACHVPSIGADVALPEAAPAPSGLISERPMGMWRGEALEDVALATVRRLDEEGGNM